MSGTNPTELDPEKTKALRILAVEDNKMNQKLIGFMLQNWGFQYEVSPDGHDACERLLKGHFDAVLMDIELPLLNGYESTQKIRYELKLDIPIIAMTAHENASDRDKCVAAGMNDYVSKPIDEEILKEKLIKYLHLS